MDCEEEKETKEMKGGEKKKKRQSRESEEKDFHGPSEFGRSGFSRNLPPKVLFSERDTSSTPEFGPRAARGHVSSQGDR